MCMCALMLELDALRRNVAYLIIDPRLSHYSTIIDVIFNADV